MIITKIRLQEEHPMTGAAGSWPLPICDFNLDSSAGNNGYILKLATGLDPVKSISVVEGFDSFGTSVMGSISDKREIGFRIVLNPQLGQSYSSLRDNLYKFKDRNVIVKFMDESIIIAQTSGYIRECEAVQFSDQPDIQMTIECEDGELSAPNPVTIPLSTLNNTTPVINYDEGTAPAGLELKFRAIAAGSGFTISNHARVWFVGATQVYNQFALTYSFLTNDEVTISTHPHDKRVSLLRGATTYDLAGYLNAGAVWPKLYSGVNTFEWNFSAGWMLWLSASYIPKFWGV